MGNINRDYFLQVDAKSSSIVSNNNMTFYITDKNTANFFIKLVVNMSNNENISNYVSIEEASNYSIELNIIKPNNELKTITGTLLNEQEALYLFNLPLDYTDQQGTYKCELFVKCIVNEQEEIVTSNEFSYTVKKSIINDLDEVIETDSDYPILLNLIKKVEDLNATDVSTLATITYVDEKVASIDISDIDLSSYATKTELTSKVDKVVGKSLIADTEISRLASVVNYIHPTTHLPSVITQDSNNRFVTDTEKTTWNAKSNLTLGTTSTTAYRGDYGNTAYTHSQSTHAPSTAQKNSDITKAEIEAKLTGSITSHNHNYANTIHTHIKSDITDFSHVHSYNELTDKPTIPTVPTNLSEFTNDSNFATQYYVDTKVSEIDVLDNYYTKLETDTKIATIPKGDKGDIGPQGIQGIQGIQGETGPKGEKGDTGETGLQGDKGEKGDTGLQGIQGLKGDKGDPFLYSNFTTEQLASLVGPKGDKGDKGDTGPQGPKGADGVVTFETLTEEQKLSLKGEQGIQGATGPQGIQGEKGDKGDTGAQGPQGLQGPKGDTGLKGDTGATGPQGDPVATNYVGQWVDPTTKIKYLHTYSFTVGEKIYTNKALYQRFSVPTKYNYGDIVLYNNLFYICIKLHRDHNFVLSITLNDSCGVTHYYSTPNFGEVVGDNDPSTDNPIMITNTNYWKPFGGFQSYTGPQGPKGEDGTVTFEALTQEQKLSLKGDKGDPFTYSDFTQEQLALLVGPQGEKGDKGDIGPQGEIGPQGPKGQDGTVAFDSLSDEQKLSLKGDKGDTGPQGETGIQGDIGPQGNPGYTPVKGTDYFTSSDIASLNIPTSTSQLTNDSNFTTNTYVDSKVGLLIKTLQITQASYDALTTKDTNTLYVIVG